MLARAAVSMAQHMVLLGCVFSTSSPVAAQPAAPAVTPPAAPAAVAEARAETPHGRLIQSVSLSPVVAFAGADMKIVVRVQPEAGNRRLQLSVDGATFYASTERQLDGVDGARAHTFNLQELPAGDYQIVAVLEGNDGVRSRITRSFKVMGEDDTQYLESPRPTQRRRRGSN